MKLTEEFVLLLLNEQSGYLELVPGWELSCVMAGAVIADLALEFRIDTDLTSLVVTNSEPTGDELLDPTLAEIANEVETQNAQFWIERSAKRAEEIIGTTLDRMVSSGVLDYDSGGFWSLKANVAISKKYPTEGGGSKGAEVRSRILSLIFGNEIPDPRDIILINLMHTCDGFSHLLSPEDYAEKKERIELLASMDLIGQALFKAVRQSAITPKTSIVFKAKSIPRLKVRDLLNCKPVRIGNMPYAMAELYQKYGSVFQAPMKVKGERLFVLAGPKANQWVHKNGRFYLRSKDYIQDFEAELGASKTLPGMDGAEHFRMRKSLRQAYSRATLAVRLHELFLHCRSSLQQWTKGSELKASEVCQRHMSSQVSHLTIGVDCSDYIDDLLEYQHRALVVHVQGAIPKFMMSTPRMNRARKNVMELVNSIHSTHTQAQRAGRTPDLADSILGLHRNDPQFMPETDMNFPFVASLQPSIYLGSSLGFALYAMATKPELQERVYREAEAIFGNGKEPVAEDFNASAINVTHRIFLESERLYPVIPWQLRHVMNSFEFDSYEIPMNSNLLIAQTASHYLEDLYENPLEFDIDRFSEGREEHMAPGAYAPYGLGTHTCLGHRWVELQMVCNLLLIAYHFKIEIAPAKYKLRINPFPTAAPSKGMKIRVTEIRNKI